MDEHQFKYGRSAPIAEWHNCGIDPPAKPHPLQESAAPTPPQQTKSASGVIAHDILTEAAAIVCGDRNIVHGDKERSFTVIAGLWTAYLNGRSSLDRDAPVRAIDVAQMMVLMKIARSIQGQPIRDHYVDAAGYAAIAGELAAANLQTKETIWQTPAPSSTSFENTAKASPTIN